MIAPAGDTISFAPFRLLSAQRLLLDDGKPVRLGSRAFDILIALAERHPVKATPRAEWPV